MRNVEVYVNSDAIKSSVNDVSGYKITDNSTSSDEGLLGFSTSVPSGVPNIYRFSIKKLDSAPTHYPFFRVGMSGGDGLAFDPFTGNYVIHNTTYPITASVTDIGGYWRVIIENSSGASYGAFSIYASVHSNLNLPMAANLSGLGSIIIKDFSMNYGVGYTSTWTKLNDFSNWTNLSSDVESVSEYITNTEDWTRLDLFDYETIDITNSIQDVKEIGKVFTDFSKEFDVPASNTNNKVFKHYYNPDIDGFDARFKLDALIKIDGVDYRKGKISLLGSSLHNDMAKSYQVVFYGETVALSDLLGDDTLRDLSDVSGGATIDNYNFEYTQDTISLGFEEGYIYNSSTGLLEQVSDNSYDLCFPFISASSFYFYDTENGINPKDNVDSRNIYAAAINMGVSPPTNPPYGVHYDDLKPALRLDKIIKGIEEKYNISFSDDFFNSSNKPYYDLFLWLQRESGVLSDQIGSESTETKLSDFVYDVSSAGADWRVDEFGFSDKRFIKSGFAAGISSLTLRDYANLKFDVTLPSAISHTIEIYANIWTKPNSSSSFTQVAENEKVYSKSDTSLGVTHEHMFNNYVSTTNGYEVLYEVTIKIIVPSTISSADIENVEISRHAGASDTWFPANYEDIGKTFTPDFTSITDYMPKIKVIDFLTGLFKMFNLTAYYDGSEIIVRTLDDYYENGTEYNLTKHIDTSTTEVNRNNLYSQIDMMFAKSSTFAAQNANEIQNSFRDFGNEKLDKVYSEFQNDFNLAFDGGKYEVKLPFEKIMYERMIDQKDNGSTNIQWGWFCSKDENPVLGKPLLFYPIKKTQPILFDKNVKMRDKGWNSIGGSWDNTSSYVDGLFSYIMPSNSTDDYSQSVNFGSEFDEYTLDNQTNSLFSNYWLNYISNIYNKKSRIFTTSAFLPTHILTNLKLNDIVVIGNRKYRINKLEVNLNNGKAKLELFNDLGYYD